MQSEKNRFLTSLKKRWKKHTKELAGLDHQAGASLIEILVAVSIIVILATGIGIAVLSNIGKAQNAMAKQHISTLNTALESYALEHYDYPEEGNWSGELAEYLSTGKVPPDPWGNNYIYKKPGEEGRAYDLYSMGQDKSEGTEDDITSWGSDEEGGGTANGGGFED